MLGCDAGEMSVFEDPAPPSAPPPEYRTPEWIAPPENVIPATVALDVILVQRADLAIWVADALVFASGLSFGISVRRRERSDAPPLFFGRDEPASSRPLTAGEATKLPPPPRRRSVRRASPPHVPRGRRPAESETRA